MTTNRVWPALGQRLMHRRSSGEVVTAEVVSVDENRKIVKLRIADRDYQSLSAAARAITGHSTNGWVFWGLYKQSGAGDHQSQGRNTDHNDGVT